MTPRKAYVSEYERFFPPFFVQSHTILGPRTRDPQKIEHTETELDEIFTKDQPCETPAPSEWKGMLRASNIRPQEPFPVREIIAKIHGTADHPIDLTSNRGGKAAQAPIDMLKAVPMKYIKHHQDVRPPYIGTWTQPLDSRIRKKLPRNPFARELPSTNYDYDSEAEWEEPGEGEDLDSEDEEIGDDEDADDMDGFLDDAEADEVKKRRPLIGDLEPTCTGLCWEDSHGLDGSSDKSPKSSLNLKPYRLDILLGNARQPKIYHLINPV